MTEDLQKKYDVLLDRHLKLQMKFGKRNEEFQKIRDIVRTKKCDALCGLCHLFENGCLIWNEKINPRESRTVYDPPT